MRTEDDLREAFDRLAAEAPDATVVLNELARRDATAPPRRHRLKLAVAVVATAAAAVAAPLVVNQVAADPQVTAATPPAAPPSAAPPPGPVPFRLQLPSGWTQTADRTINAAAITLNVAGPGEVGCMVSAYSQGALLLSKLRGATPVAPVNGHRAVSADYLSNAPYSAPGERPPRVLAFEYRAGSWAMTLCFGRSTAASAGVASDHGIEQLNRTVAQATDFTVTQEFLVPLKVGRLPDGLRATAAQVTRRAPGRLDGSGFELRGSSALQILLHVTGVHLAPFPPDPKNTDLPGTTHGSRTSRFAPNGSVPTLTVRDGELEYRLIVAYGRLADPRAELSAIADRITVADPDLPATWFPFELQ